MDEPPPRPFARNDSFGRVARERGRVPKLPRTPLCATCHKPLIPQTLGADHAACVRAAEETGLAASLSDRHRHRHRPRGTQR